MINFLPQEAKSTIKREYFIRTGSVWALLLAGVGAVALALLLPTYVLLVRQLDALASETIHMEDVVALEVYQMSRAELEKAQTLATMLETSGQGPSASEVLRKIREVQMSTITLSGFSYEHTGTAVGSVRVRGIAATREALAAFSAALERNPLFSQAVVPVSDLAEGHNLPFTLTIVISTTDTSL